MKFNRKRASLPAGGILRCASNAQRETTEKRVTRQTVISMKIREAATSRQINEQLITKIKSISRGNTGTHTVRVLLRIVCLKQT